MGRSEGLRATDCGCGLPRARTSAPTMALAEGARYFERVSGPPVSGQSGIGSRARRNQSHLGVDRDVSGDADQAAAELTSRRKLGPGGGGRIGAAGAGRRRVEETDQQLRGELTRMVEETTGGDPMSALRWTNKSTEAMAEELTRRGHPVSDRTVARM
jgi:Rhodopirellula transposase DDE domain